MSRQWSHIGVRASAVVLLLAGVASGLCLDEDRQAQQRGVDAQRAADVDRVELEYLKREHLARMPVVSRARAAEYDAARKAAAAARQDAERARRAEEAASRKRREAPPYAGPIPESCEEYTGNRKIGCAILIEQGFPLEEMPCLDKLWTKESGWNHKAHNTSSGAYGIPQALPGSKMASVGDDWEYNPATQIKWGLGYIKGRYGTPCKAWAHSHSKGWY